MELKAEIKHIQYLLDEHIENHPTHKESCLDLKKKFKDFEIAVENGQNIDEFLYWCKWFAPRIIYDGIGNKEILVTLEAINKKFTT